MKNYLSLAALMCALCFILDLTLVVAAPNYAAAFDGVFHALVVPLQTPEWSSIFMVVTFFGSTTGIVVGLATLIIFYRHRPDVIIRLLLALLGSTVTTEYLKDIVARLRPPTLPWLTPLNSFSFPSGHSTESIVLYGFLATLLYSHAVSPGRRIVAVLVPIAIILFVGSSRVILNYHFATDVLGGYFVGGFWLTVSLSMPLYHEFYHNGAHHSEPATHALL